MMRKVETIGVREIRGRTTRGRLAPLDALMIPQLASWLQERPQAAVIDVGYGEHGWTTLEFFEALREAGVMSPVVGLEVEAHRVEGAQTLARPGLRFVQGGFELEEATGQQASLVRAMNVLRQYAPQEVEGAHRAWGRALIEGGYLIEGTCDGTGALGSVHVLQRRGEALEKLGLLLWTDFSKGFGPWMFRDWLPADLRRSLKPRGDSRSPSGGAQSASVGDSRSSSGGAQSASVGDSRSSSGGAQSASVGDSRSSEGVDCKGESEWGVPGEAHWLLGAPGGASRRGGGLYEVLARWAELAVVVRAEGICENARVFEESLARLSRECAAVVLARDLWGQGGVWLAGGFGWGETG
ncbi:hypothetical protein DL240_10940 [Lujinxingia litoralis]|uniref:Methylase n=1 Tax=Lujinxingia litoralis TaxID=2211119 RepID=A0A328CAW9_9DELT|nr:hypothetical protein [Lujinxingia litoralis]RAL22357.1 hypothetical protein DL240_10940 [Lujinxingia litoralis]